MSKITISRAINDFIDKQGQSSKYASQSSFDCASNAPETDWNDITNQFLNPDVRNVTANFFTEAELGNKDVAFIHYSSLEPEIQNAKSSQSHFDGIDVCSFLRNSSYSDNIYMGAEMEKGCFFSDPYHFFQKNLAFEPQFISSTNSTTFIPMSGREFQHESKFDGHDVIEYLKTNQYTEDVWGEQTQKRSKLQIPGNGNISKSRIIDSEEQRDIGETRRSVERLQMLKQHFQNI